MRKPVSISNQAYDAIYRSPVAPLGIKIQNSSLATIDWLQEAVAASATPSKAVAGIVRVLDQYFDDPRSTAAFTCSLNGTAFQQRVWRALQTIPPGEVMTYGQLARKLKTSSQAIGQACRTNPISVLIPCHRIVAAQGLGGYMGRQRQLHIKKWLLHHEGVMWV